VIAELSLVGIEGGNEERLAGITERKTLTFYDHLAFSHNVEKDIGRFLVKKVDVIDVKNTTVSFGEEAGREDCLAGLEGLLKIGRTDEAILHYVEGHLNKGSGDNLRLTFREGKTAIFKFGLGEVVESELALRIDVERRILDDLDGRKELVEGASHDRLGCTLAAGDDYTPHAVVDGRKEERLLDIVLSDDH